MTEPLPIQSPSELLSQQIILRFLQDGLVSNEFSSEIQELFLSPSPTPEDWQLLVEKILESEKMGDKDD